MNCNKARLFYSSSFTLLSSQLFTILLSRQRVDEFEIEHDLVDEQVLVT